MANIGQTHQLGAVRGDLALSHEAIEATVALVSVFNLPAPRRAGITGVVTHTQDGEFVEIWVTHDRDPYLLNAIYERVA